MTEKQVFERGGLTRKRRYADIGEPFENLAEVLRVDLTADPHAMSVEIVNLEVMQPGHVVEVGVAWPRRR